MPFINWVPEYDLGNDVIDIRHRRLAELANVLHDAALAKESVHVLSSSLKELVEYARVHFAEEEALAAKYAPDELPLQRAAHRQMIRKLKDILCISQNNPARAALELTAMVKDFLIRHVLRMDKRLASYLPKDAAA